MYRERVSRAKQFIPFDALKGFREALQAKERIVVPKMELSEERMEELDQKIRQIKPGGIATIVYFHEGEYIKITGMVSKFSEISRMIQIVNTKVSLDDICQIEIEEEPLNQV